MMEVKNVITALLSKFGLAAAGPEAPASTVREATSSQSEDAGWTRLTGNGLAKYNEKDLTPVAQERMQKLAEFLWQSNLLANRLIELPLAYLIAEGVKLVCKNEANQKLLDAFWNDPINNWPIKMPPRIRTLSLLGEQCYITHVREGDGFVRLGYLDPRQIATVVMDPDNPEQPIGVATKQDASGKFWKYRTVVIGDDAQLFTERTQKIRTEIFKDGECLLFQVNKFPSGARGRSDLLAQMDWLDAYEGFLFDEIDRMDYLRRFVWDVTLTGADPDSVKKFDKEFKVPSANSKFVHNDSVKLEAISPTLGAAETEASARILRNHVLGGATVPEHWFGGGGDVNRAAASEMGEPTFKMLTARQTYVKQMLEEIGRFVLWKAQRTEPAEINWADEEWKVTAVFPELVSKDLTKFASALSQVATCVVLLIDNGLLTEERGLQLVSDIAGRFGQEIDAKQELEAARAESKTREEAKAKRDAFNLDGDVRDLLSQGRAKPGGGDGANTSPSV